MTGAELVSEHSKHLPEPEAAEMLDFVQFVGQEQGGTGISQPRQPGSARGHVWMAQDFDVPLDDLTNYQ